MKSFLVLIITVIILVMGVGSCVIRDGKLGGGENCQREPTGNICDTVPSDSHLVTAWDANFRRMKLYTLRDPSHEVKVCGAHFAASDPSGEEVDAAVEEINRQLGSTVDFTLIRAPHRSGPGLYRGPNLASRFDYLDISDSLPTQCGTDTDQTFTMRCCPWDQSLGKLDHFVLMANTSDYTHFSSPSSSNYPRRKQIILHEFMHALGLGHANEWDSTDKAKFITSMMGGLKYLSAVDVAFMRRFYSTSTHCHRNYVASTLTKFEGRKGKFEDQNPDGFTISSNGDLLDNSTNADPNFLVAWFNTGTEAGESGVCGFNRLYLRQVNDHSQEIEIKTWPIATMPAVSQDQFRGQLSVSVSNPTSINTSVDWELVFRVNHGDLLDEETDEDNEIVKPITLN